MIPRILSCSLILAFVSVPVFAQTSNPASTQPGTATPKAITSVPVLPKNPKDLMLLAKKVNGLASIAGEPWHIKANYQTFDADGKPKDKGEFEEWWAGPERYKISYTGADFNQVIYWNEGRGLVTGDNGWAPLPQAMIGEYLRDPFPSKNETDKGSRYSSHNRKLGGISLKCIESKSASRFDGSVQFCFEPNPVVRLEYTPGGVFVAFNNVIRAGDHYLPKEVIIGSAGVTIAKANVTFLKIPSNFENSEFVAPASAVPITGRLPRIVMPPGLRRISGKDPKYPAEAKRSRIQGTIVLEAIIAKDGTVDDLYVISGPKALRKSAADAVKTWKYGPYMWQGQPQNIDMTINVVYTLGG